MSNQAIHVREIDFLQMKTLLANVMKDIVELHNYRVRDLVEESHQFKAKECRYQTCYLFIRLKNDPPDANERQIATYYNSAKSPPQRSEAKLPGIATSFQKDRRRHLAEWSQPPCPNQNPFLL